MAFAVALGLLDDILVTVGVLTGAVLASLGDSGLGVAVA